MLLLHAFRNRSIALLWCGQALSAVGDEIYRVALIWMAVGLIGADTGYLAAGQCAALLAMSFLGGAWADRWDHFKTLIWVDLARALIVLLPVIASRFVPVTLPLLWGVALGVSALGAFFDPALQSMLPRFSRDRRTLQAATTLMSTTLRLARVVGPGIISLLTTFLPTIHFFTLDALTFALSALSISLLRNRPKERADPARNAVRAKFRESITSGLSLLKREPDIRSIVHARALATGAWSLAYSLGLALLVKEIAPDDVRAFGMVIAAYGCGNILGVIGLGSFERKRPARMVFVGYLILGLGFVLIGHSSGIQSLMLAAAFGAIGGPMNDIGFMDLVQVRYNVDEIPKIFRTKTALDTAFTLGCMLASPLLFRSFKVQSVISACGILCVGIGIWGLLKFVSESDSGELVSSAP